MDGLADFIASLTPADMPTAWIALGFITLGVASLVAWAMTGIYGRRGHD